MNDLRLKFSDMLSIKEFHEHCDDEELEISIFTGYDKAIIGMAMQGPRQVVVYSLDLLVDVMMDINEWTEEEALEWYGFNMTGYHDGCPVVLHTGIYQTGVQRHGTG